jgi:branched-chain amino acid aminotransferase
VLAWCNGDVVPLKDIRISPMDHGFTVGDGVFEALKVVEGTPFALRRHLERLAHSATGLGLPQLDQEHVRAAVMTTIESNERMPLARVRITYTAGPSPLGSPRADLIEPTLLVLVAPMHMREGPGILRTVPWVRNERSAVAGLKTTSYADNVVALAYARERGADEALFADTRGNLCEGTGSNVFVVHGGTVRTPALSTGCLAGITRDLVIEWGDVVEDEFPIADLLNADEVFVTSSTRDIQPVARVDDRSLTCPGPRTVDLMDLFAKRAGEDADP